MEKFEFKEPPHVLWGRFCSSSATRVGKYQEGGSYRVM
jgi:hypothetical protein